MTTLAPPGSETETPPPLPADPPSTRRELRKAAIRLGKFFTLLAVIWLILFTIYVELPFTRPGTDLIYGAKTETAAGRPLFTRNTPNRIVIFGNSMVLAGFIPDEFDSLAAGKAESYNMGVPDEIWFMATLKKILLSGTRPTHVVFTIPWVPDVPTRTGIFNFIESDTKFLKSVFPFRQMPRDLVLFAIRSRSHGGVKASYEYARASVAKMFDDRGYYFIEGQSHYANNMIPDDLVFDGDVPDAPVPRNVVTTGHEFTELRALAEQYDFQVHLAPFYCRDHARGEPPPVNEDTRAALIPYPRMHVIGPDYFRFPNKYFSDHVHANPDGARLYTRKIYELVSPTFLPRSAEPAR